MFLEESEEEATALGDSLSGLDVCGVYIAFVMCEVDRREESDIRRAVAGEL